MNHHHSHNLRVTPFAYVLFGILLLGGFSVVRSAPLVALTASNKLLRLETTSPDLIQGTVGVSGLQSGEKLLAIDFCPSN